MTFNNIHNIFGNKNTLFDKDLYKADNPVKRKSPQDQQVLRPGLL